MTPDQTPGGGGRFTRHAIYYYTPLPLNLANKQASKQQASNKQALLLSVLAIASPHRYGLYSTLATLQPRWWPCQIQVLSQKPTGPGAGVASWEGPSQHYAFLCPKTDFRGLKRPQTLVKTDKQRETVATFHVRLDCPVTKSPFLPSNSTICPRNGPKMAKNGPECAQFASNNPKTKNGPYLGLRGSNLNSDGT